MEAEPRTTEATKYFLLVGLQEPISLVRGQAPNRCWATKESRQHCPPQEMGEKTARDLGYEWAQGWQNPVRGPPAALDRSLLSVNLVSSEHVQSGSL